MVTPGRAAVRPRVVSPVSGEALLLEEEVRSLVDAGQCGWVRITGPAGSGKSTALRHLAAVLDDPRRLRCVDAATRSELGTTSHDCLTVYAAPARLVLSHVAVFELAPWGEDELIEYLMAVHRDACGSVLGRLRESADREWLGGNPELCAVVLDRMAQDSCLRSPWNALQRELGRLRLGTDYAPTLARLCVLSLDAWAKAPYEAHPVGQPGALGELHRLLRHRPARLVMAADCIADDLEQTEHCVHLTTRLPRDLVREVARDVAGDAAVLEKLNRELASPQNRSCAMAASILLAADENWRPPNTASLCLEGAWLDRARWGGALLSGANLASADLRSADLSGADLSRCVAADANLSGARLSGANLKNADLTGASLARADLSLVVGNKTRFVHANLLRATLAGASLPGAHFNRADLTAARLAEADLTLASFLEAEIRDADFSGANMTEAVLSGVALNTATFTGAVFRSAVLARSNLEGMELPDADFTDAWIEQALLSGSRMPRAVFVRANLRDTGLAEIDWEGAVLRGADLRGATFHMGSSRSGLVGSPLAGEGTRTGFYTDDYAEQEFKAPEEIRKANLCGADLRGARLDDVDFYLVDLRGAKYDSEQAQWFAKCGAILRSRA